MYESFYQLKEKPFNLSPDPRFIYFTERHCEALANLVYGIRERKGFLVLSGEVGTGKTTLVNALLDTLDRTGILSAFVFNPILTSAEFFEYLMADLNLKADVRSKSQVLIKLNSLLLERYRTGQITVLIVDEAQNLSPEILEEIRLLTNLETATEKLLQIVLVGQPELSLKLNSPELRQLKQRISLRCTLDPLTLSETREYIRTRMEIAGVPNQQIFSDSTITEVFRCSGGIPRLVNTICDNALLNGYACDTRSIGVEIIHEVAEDLELSEAHRYPLRRARTAGERRTFGDLVAEGDYLEPRNNGKADSHESESFDLFVQFVDKLRDRSK
ncbi:MAG: AAA family ATPase [Acidobacteria bacterium]|nr:AAA family ATPase [Acidobacteriota bacterium]MCI0718372.1 AAA family ATPase [Acidobacteriota bacterium]